MTAPPVLVVHCETRLPAVVVVMAVSAPLKPERDALNEYEGQSSVVVAKLFGAIAIEPMPNTSASIPGMTTAIIGSTKGRRENWCPRVFDRTPIAPNAPRPPIGTPLPFCAFQRRKIVAQDKQYACE